MLYSQQVQTKKKNTKDRDRDRRRERERERNVKHSNHQNEIKSYKKTHHQSTTEAKSL